MASSRAPNSAVHQTRVKQSGSRVKPEVATVSLARGVFGGGRRAGIETEREQSNAGESPKTLEPCACVHWYQACPWTYNNSRDLSLNSFSSRLFVLQNSIDIARISFFLFSLYNAQTFKYFFFYLRIWLFTSKSDTHVSQSRALDVDENKRSSLAAVPHSHLTHLIHAVDLSLYTPEHPSIGPPR